MAGELLRSCDGTKLLINCAGTSLVTACGWQTPASCADLIGKTVRFVFAGITICPGCTDWPSGSFQVAASPNITIEVAGWTGSVAVDTGVSSVVTSYGAAGCSGGSFVDSQNIYLFASCDDPSSFCYLVHGPPFGFPPGSLYYDSLLSFPMPTATNTLVPCGLDIITLATGGSCAVSYR